MSLPFDGKTSSLSLHKAGETLIMIPLSFKQLNIRDLGIGNTIVQPELRDLVMIVYQLHTFHAVQPG